MIEHLQPNYSNSWSLVIGINKYESNSLTDLSSAKNDAEKFKDTLVDIYGFPPDNVTLLLDEDATGSRIKEAFLEYSEITEEDDRVIVFFAGHGYTKTGKRGEVGYLVPQDGNIDELDTLIRMDELTRSADVILAKHIFFIMDACYGALAIPRTSGGTERFMKDMLRRRACQILTAGKADEVVTDGSGIRSGHSLFTAYLLNGLEGEATREEGIITANGLMAYVYEKVSNDPHSNQTPHFVTLDGEGDFVFNPPASLEQDDAQSSAVHSESEGEAGEKDVLISVPFVEIESVNVSIPELEQILEQEKNAIALERYISPLLQRFTGDFNLENFPNSNEAIANTEKIHERIREYEKNVEDLQRVAILIAILTHLQIRTMV